MGPSWHGRSGMGTLTGYAAPTAQHSPRARESCQAGPRRTTGRVGLLARKRLERRAERRGWPNGPATNGAVAAERIPEMPRGRSGDWQSYGWWSRDCRCFIATPTEDPRGGDFVCRVSSRSGTRRCKGTQGLHRFGPLRA
jgi:hypothetical protein